MGALENGCRCPPSRHRAKGKIFLATQSKTEQGTKFDFKLFDDPFEFHKLVLGATPDEKQPKTAAEKRAATVKEMFGICLNEMKCFGDLMERCAETVEESVDECVRCEACVLCKIGDKSCPGT